MYTSTKNKKYIERIQTYFEVPVVNVSSSLPKQHCSPWSCPSPASTRFSIGLPSASVAEFVRFSLLLIPVSFHQQRFEVHGLRTHGNGYLLPPDLSVITIVDTFSLWNSAPLEHIVKLKTDKALFFISWNIARTSSMIAVATDIWISFLSWSICHNS